MSDLTHDVTDEPAEVPGPESAEAGDAPEASDAPEAAVEETGEETGEESGGEAAEGSAVEGLESEGDIAADYLEELLDIADLDGDLDIDVEGDRAVVSVVGADLSHLVGSHGQVLDALQELTRLAVYRETGERSRLMLDISEYRANRRRVLEEEARELVSRVRETGERVALEPMTAFERKVVHDEVKAAGLTSESEGTEPRRYVVILPE